MNIRLSNIFENIPAELKDELIEVLLSGKGVRVERIISMGHASPPGFWYDQEQDEFVILLKGSAGLRFDGREQEAVIKAGDYINIPAHLKHRVEWTDPHEHTIWLALFYENK